MTTGTKTGSQAPITFPISEDKGGTSQASVGSALVTSVGSTAARSLAARFADVVNVKDFGAVGDGVTDDTGAIQAALATGKHVFLPSGATFKLTNSLYMAGTSQEFSGGGTLTMDASLGKPCLWLGATDASGTPASSPVVNIKVRGVRFLGTGTKAIGSAGIAFQKATTATLDAVFSWGFYAGIDVRGTSLVNHVINADLRQNAYGVYDRTDSGGTINFQGSEFIGGRIEQNASEGVVLGSSDVRFVGTIIEGNSNTGQGGDGTNPEVRITPGFLTGGVDFVSCYMETIATNTATSMVQVDADASRRIGIVGGQYYGNDAVNRYIVKSNSNSTAQSVMIVGGQFKTFKNYVSATIANNSAVSVYGSWADASVALTTDVSASAGARVYQADSFSGPRSNQAITSDVASGSNAVTLTQGQRLLFGSANSYLYSDGASRIRMGPGLFIADSFAINGGAFTNNQAASFDIKGNQADGATSKAVRLGSANAMSTAGGQVATFYSDNFSTEVGSIRRNASTWGLRLKSPDGTWYLLTIANGGTVSIAADP